VPAAIGGLAVFAALFITHLDPMKMASGVFRHGQPRHDPSTKVLWLGHGKTATVSLVDADGRVSIATNGKPDAAINMHSDKAAPDEITMVMAAALPLSLHPHPERIANIGMGSGLTTHVLLASDAVKSVDTIEIEPYMAKAAEIGFMPRVQRTFRDPRSHIHFEDAKTFFAVNHKKYDIIVSEPSNPWVSGVSTLFSSEFYQQMTRYLEPDGLLVQWIQIYETDLSIVTSIVKAMQPQFEDFAIYSADDSDLLIVARRSGRLPELNARVFDTPAMRAELERVGITRLQHLSGHYLGNRQLLEPLLRVSGVPANSDYFPYVDLNAPRTRILKRDALEYPMIATLPVPLFDLLGKAQPQNEPTDPSSAPNTARDQMVVRATVLRDALLTSNYEPLAPAAASVMIALDSSAPSCTQPAVRRAWLAAATGIAESTSSALSVPELTAMWEKIRAKPCASALDADEGQMLTLLESIAVRDTAAAANAGRALFTRNYAFGTQDQVAIALIATAASDIQQNRSAEAAELIREVRPRLDSNRSSQLALTWLSAIAAAQPSTGSAVALNEAAAAGH
jgi:spermidine synthase